MFTDIRVMPMRTNALSMLLASAALLLAGCGGGSADSGSFQPPSTGTIPPVAASLVVTSSVASLLADGSVPANITALVKDSNNVVLKGVPVTLSTTSGALSAGSGTSDGTGQVNVTLTTGGDATVRTITVTARSGTLTATVAVPVGAPPVTSIVPASLVVTSSLTTILADGSAPATLTALVRDANNVVLKDVTITLKASSGALSVGTANSDSAGQVASQLSTGGDSAVRTITVTAKAGTLTSTINIAVGVPPTTSQVAALTLVAGTPSIPSDGSITASVTAIARDASNLLMQGLPVTFTATSGGLAVTQPVTDAKGQAVAQLSTAGDATPRNITITASVGGKTATTVVAVAASVPATTVSLGSGSGSSFVPNVLALGSSSLSVGGSTSITATLVQSNGTLYTSPATISFNSPCVASGNATIPATATTSTGQVSVTYSAKGCAGNDTITATTSVGSQNLSATGTVNVAQAAIGSIAYVSATPTNIALKGTGDATRPEVSTVIFRVLDVSGGPRAGATVSFALNTTVGGITLTSATATSDASGNVQAIVNAGTIATPVRVTATVSGTTPISTQSSQLSISTGIPTAGSFSLAAACFNIEGLNYDGTTTTLTARLADRFSNPAPNGTAVSFQSEGGSVLSQCLTTTTSSEGGLCSVDIRSSNPRPADGRLTVLATAIGEESFTDADGNGVFTAADGFRLTASGGLPAQDLGEPYLDINENAAYDIGEPFYDFNTSGLRDSPDSKFNGALCQDAARCPDLTVDPTRKSAPIGASTVIIFSGSNALITKTDGTALASLTMPVSSTTGITVWVRDINGNPMPGSTIISGSVANAGLSIIAPSSYNMPCTAAPANSLVSGATVFTFGVASGTTLGTGQFTVSVKTPKGNETLARISVTVQ